MKKAVLIVLLAGMSQNAMALDFDYPKLPPGSTEEEIHRACRSAFIVLRQTLRENTDFGPQRRAARRAWWRFRCNCPSQVRDGQSEDQSLTDNESESEIATESKPGALN